MVEVQKKIGCSEPMICGGVPRDKYIGQLDKISDLDITTGDKSVHYLSEEFSYSLKQKYNIMRRIMEDGHSTIYIGNLKIDFSSNFNIHNIDSILHNLNIKNPSNMQKEMFSRDFTCNALLLSIDLKNIMDPTYKGFEDLKNKNIRTCLAPEITLTTNKNRVIRSIYLAAKLGFNIDKSIIDFVRNNLQSVKIATEKSLHDKINEAFKWDADRASYFITKMNIWEYVPITEVVYPYYMRHRNAKTIST